MPEVALRPSTADDDAAQITWVHSAEEVERFAGPSLTFPLTPGQLQAHRDDPDVHPFVAYLPPDAATPVGRLDVVRRSATTARLARVLIDPARRGEGLARPMVGAAVAWARAQGFTEMTLAVFRDNAAALRTYEALGFTEDGVQPDARLHELRAPLTAPG
jgi:GNAT superfamily N-acetyltransferase